MKAFMYMRPGVMLGEAPEPQIVNPDEVKIKMHYCAFCGSDKHLVQGVWDTRSDGVGNKGAIIGHEATGEIVELGPEATVKGLKVGDKVCVYHKKYCGRCFFCRNGQEHLCTNRITYAHMMAEYVVASEQAVFKLPDNMDTLIGCAAEPVSVCLHAVDLLNVKPGNNAVVYGAGLGLIALQLLKLAGATDVTVVTRTDAKKNLALSLGADRVLASSDPDFLEKARAVTDGRGFQKGLEMSGSPQAAKLILQTISRGGNICYFSNYPEGFNLPVDAASFVNDEISMTGVFQSPYMFPRVMAVLPKLNLEYMRDNIYPLDDVMNAWDAHMSGKYPRVVVKLADDIG